MTLIQRQTGKGPVPTQRPVGTGAPPTIQVTAPTHDVHKGKNHRYPEKPEWSYGKAGTLYQSNSGISGQPTHAPNSQPFSAGYDIAATRIHDQKRLHAAEQTYNAVISDGQFQMSIHVLNIAIDIALSGTYAQGRWTRDFYPHNFTQPSFIVSGQSLDQGFYGKLCEFVHQAQHKAVFDGPAHMTQLVVYGNQHPRKHKHSMTVYDGSRSNADLGITLGVADKHGMNPNQSIRGTHNTIAAKGYITTMPRVHQQGVAAPTWQFTFVVSTMFSGPYQDYNQFSLKRGNSWIQMLADTQNNGALDTSTLEAANKKTLAKAAKNSANIFNPSGN